MIPGILNLGISLFMYITRRYRGSALLLLDIVPAVYLSAALIRKDDEQPFFRLGYSRQLFLSLFAT